MFERPSIFRRFACWYSCSFVLRLPEPELPEDRERVRDADERDRDAAGRARAADERDREAAERVREADELRVRDLPVLLAFVRREPLARELDPPLRAPALRREAAVARRPADSRSGSSDDSSSPISFFATPTAAGIATPTAAPAATFFVVDIPSCSCSGSISHLHCSTFRSSPLARARIACAFVGLTRFLGLLLGTASGRADHLLGCACRGAERCARSGRLRRGPKHRRLTGLLLVVPLLLLFLLVVVSLAAILFCHEILLDEIG
jgi:hypothetical protein